MVKHSNDTLGTELYGLRHERGLGIRELARLAGTTKRSVQDWETNRYVPSGPALDRLLDALEAPNGTRSRLLAQTAPRYARLALAEAPLGAPVDVGQVLRAMRLRQGSTQADVAREIGVSQATFARWEAGDTEPTAEVLHGALFALGATPEEALALMSVERQTEIGDLDDAYARLVSATTAPLALRDVLLLGLESELWWRATGDPAAEPALANLISARAHQCLLRGELDAVDGHVRRALKLARPAKYADHVIGAVYAHCWMRRRTPEGALGAARSLDRWIERMKDESSRQWLRSTQGFAILRSGEVWEGIGRLRGMVREAHERDSGDTAFYRVNLIEAYLLADQPNRAAEAFAELGDAGPMITAKALLAQGKEPSTELVEAVRAFGGTSWGAGREAAQVERGLERLRQGGRARFR